MITTFSGVVIRSCNSGESDRIITVLCAEYGKVTVLAKGARKTGSKFMSSASLYCYSTFTVQKEEEISFLREADAHNTFFGLHNSLPAIALAGYACAVCEDVATEDEGGMLMRLLLNTLFALSEGKKDIRIVKAAFELTVSCICGFLPDLSCCSICGGGISKESYLDVMNGTVICSDCKEKLNGEKTANDGTASVICPITPTVITALRYIISADIKRIFSFSVGEDDLPMLEAVCEKYLLNHLERSFDALDFYKTVREV